jgi:hypothetical protein|nr:MAG TPA: hypothetical protein [Caudoviricetes sp.]
MKETKKQENKKTNEKELEFKLIKTGTTIFGASAKLNENDKLEKNESLTIHY